MVWVLECVTLCVWVIGVCDACVWVIGVCDAVCGLLECVTTRVCGYWSV